MGNTTPGLSAELKRSSNIPLPELGHQSQACDTFQSAHRTSNNHCAKLTCPSLPLYHAKSRRLFLSSQLKHLCPPTTRILHWDPRDTHMNSRSFCYGLHSSSIGPWYRRSSSPEATSRYFTTGVPGILRHSTRPHRHTVVSGQWCLVLCSGVYNAGVFKKAYNR